MSDKFESITDPVMMVPSKRSLHILIVRGNSKNRPSSGGTGRAGKRKEHGWHKGWWKTKRQKKAEEKTSGDKQTA